MKRVITTDDNGFKVWDTAHVKRYEVTGVDRNGKRFKIVTGAWQHAAGINLWRGSKWLVRHDGKRELIQRTVNG